MYSNKECYIDICNIEETIPIFSQPFWLDALCGEKNWDVFIFERGGQILATLPFYIEKRCGLKYITQPPFTQIMGPWINYPDHLTMEKKLSFEKEVMTYFIDKLEDLGICFYQQKFSYKITNWLPFYWRGYQQTTRYTYRIEDISSIDEVFNNFHYSKRKNIKKAIKQELQIGFDIPAKEFYDHHRYTLKERGGVINYTFNLFERIYNATYLNNCGKTIYAKDKEGNLHSALFVIWDKSNAYNLISTIDPEYTTSGSSTLLVLEIIRFLSGKTKSFDFEGSMVEGIENSFNKFGTVQTPYSSIWKTITTNPFKKFLLSILDIRRGSSRFYYLISKIKAKTFYSH